RQISHHAEAHAVCKRVAGPGSGQLCALRHSHRAARSARRHERAVTPRWMSGRARRVERQLAVARRPEPLTWSQKSISSVDTVGSPRVRSRTGSDTLQLAPPHSCGQRVMETMHSLSPASSHARLIAVGGPLTGLVLPLNDPIVSVGRDTANTVCLADLALSRLHCTIDADSGVWRIKDRQSSNGTFVNGTQVTDRELNDRDRITLGASLFLFVVDPPGSSLPGVTDRSGQLVTRISVDNELSGDEREEEDAESRAQHDLRVLVRISTTINSAGAEADLHRELVELLAESMPAGQIASIT